jgi:YHS domain-containing protein
MRLFLILILCYFTNDAFSQTENGRLNHYNLKKNIALDRYDPVSYFGGTPSEGKEEYTFVYRGIEYWFTNSTNLNKFKASPDGYEPAYGGWCAYAMGESGEKVKVDPETFKIVDGKLYLFYNFWTNNTLEDWNENEKKLKATADSNWSKMIVQRK